MKLNLNLYKDEMYGYTAVGASKNIAWMIIRNKCHELKKQVPTFDKIHFLRELNPYEINSLKCLKQL